jgi:hypothetical protein
LLRRGVEHPINFLARAVEKWEALPLGLLQHLDLRTSMYGYVGLEDFTLYPIIRPGSLVQIVIRPRVLPPFRMPKNRYMSRQQDMERAALARMKGRETFFPFSFRNRDLLRSCCSASPPSDFWLADAEICRRQLSQARI